METQYQAPQYDGFQNEPAISSASPSSRHKKVERSCLMCHQRKIRCDKNSPCSNCARVDVLCCYPSVQQRNERRQHKTTINEVAARVARLERTITALSKNTASKGVDIESALPSQIPLDRAPESDFQTEESSPTSELLVREGGTSRYFNELLLSKILTEEDELRSVMGTPRTDEKNPPTVLSFDNGGIVFGFGSTSSDFHSLFPTRWQATQLWQIFIRNVDPMVKILHIPTIQVDLYGAITDPNNAPEDMIALLFSIYFAATTSLSSGEVANLLNQPKDKALDKYKRGIEQTLSRSNILDCPSMRSLQALTIYITCLRAHHVGRASWALNGLVLRLAKSVGLHRDGKNFGLSPFESEMRRRLWHHIDTMDVRATEDLGISLSSVDSSSDTELPLNIDDSDLSIDMTSLPVAKEKWTEMTISRIQMEQAYIGPRVVQSIGPSSATMPTQSSRSEVLKAHFDHVQNAYLKHCNENVPVQRITALMARGCLSKLDFLLRHQQPMFGTDETRKNPCRDEEVLLEACVIIESHLEIFSDEMLKGFMWYIRTFFQYYIFTCVLRYLCIKPNSPNSARAFKAIDDTFRLYGYGYNHGPKWSFMLQLKAKAERMRALLNPPDLTLTDAEESAWLQDFSAESEISSGFPGWDAAGQTDLFDWTNFTDDQGMRGL